MKQKIFLALILGIFLIGIVSTINLNSISGKTGSNIIIIQTCADSTYMNISSITYPNTSVAVSNIQMTPIGSGDFRYDFNLTSVSGTYDIRSSFTRNRI